MAEILKFELSHPSGGTKYGWVRLESYIFDQCLATGLPQKRCKIGTQLQWKATIGTPVCAVLRFDVSEPRYL